jgi:hypothetical protein
MLIDKKNIKTIDILSENFTFGQRIALNQISEYTKDFELIEGIIYALYEVKIKKSDYAKVYLHVREVLQKLSVWVEKEKLLKYEPTPEEIRAGINKISEKLGDFATVDAIAKRMHISHQNAIDLPYSTVFLMLLSDLEHTKFERRLNKIYEQKHKIK